MREPTTTSVATRVLVEFIQARGDAVQQAELAALVQDVAATSEPDAEVPLSVFAGLWRLAARVEPGIGLELLKRFQPEQMHFLGHIVTRAATLREGLLLWCRYFSLVCPSDEMVLQEDGAQAHLLYRTRDGRTPLPWMAEHYACLALACLRHFVDRVLDLQSVHFCHAPLVPMPRYAQRFGCPVLFEQTQDRFSFDRTHLDLRLVKADPYLRHFLEQQAASRLAQVQRSLSLADQVRAHCVRLLMAHEAATLETVAGLLAIGDKALQRQLRAQDENFRDLLDDAKKQVAQDLLQRGLPLVLISEQLGFAEPSVLQRACKRWFDASAGDMRRRLQSA